MVVRKVRHGLVQINGYIFEPRDRTDIDILDGKRCAFGVYWAWTGRYPKEQWQMEDFVSLWGSEEMYNCMDEDSFDELHDRWCKLTTAGDNTIRWHWWELSRVQSVAFNKRPERRVWVK